MIQVSEAFLFDEFIQLLRELVFKKWTEIKDLQNFCTQLFQIHNSYDHVYFKLLELLCDIELGLKNFDKCFEILGFNYIKKMKDEVFDYLKKNIHLGDFANYFVLHMQFFLLYSTEDTFEVLKMMKNNMPFQEIDGILDKFPSIKLRFYEFVSREIPQYCNEYFLNNMVQIYVDNNKENELQAFLKANFEKLNQEKVLEVLLKT